MAVKRPNQTPVLIVYVAAMLVSLVIFGGAAIILLNVFVTQPKLRREAAETERPEDSAEIVEDDFSSARETILFAGLDGGKINGLAVIRVIPDELTVRIVPLSQYTLSKVGDVEGTIVSLYETGGLTYLKTAAENALGVVCDKYIMISNDGWAELVDYLGGTAAYSFPQDLYYKNEDTGEITSFSKGPATRTLYGDDIRRIITYPLYDGGNETRVQVLGELSVALINSALTYNSGSVSGNIKSIFNVIYNNSDTDITSKSFDSVRSAYEHLINDSTSPATYRIAGGEWDQRGYFTVSQGFKDELQTYFMLVEEASVLE